VKPARTEDISKMAHRWLSEEVFAPPFVKGTH
jgi:hypothetical protein